MPFIEKLLKRFSLSDMKSRYKAKVTYQFIDTSQIVLRYSRMIIELMPRFSMPVSSQTKKYQDELFVLALFYHRIFPYKKLLVLDADLRFHIDIAELYNRFNDFNEKQIIGVAKDLTPHYRFAFEKYRDENPDTKIGEPGLFQVTKFKNYCKNFKKKKNSVGNLESIL